VQAGERAQFLQWAGYGTALTAGAIAVVLIATGTPGARPRPLAVRPVIGAAAGGGLLAGGSLRLAF
jgi:hypothetical protein